MFWFSLHNFIRHQMSNTMLNCVCVCAIILLFWYSGDPLVPGPPVIGADISSAAIPVHLPAASNSTQLLHPVHFYRLSYRPANSTEYTALDERISANRTVFQFNIPMGAVPQYRTLQVRLAAGNSAGVSDWSEASTAVLIEPGEWLMQLHYSNIWLRRAQGLWCTGCLVLF